MRYTIFIFWALITLNCESPNNSDNKFQWPNHPPVIKDIVDYPGTRGIRYSFDLICVAMDEDEDSLTYSWDSMGGYFVSTDSNMAHWAADSLGSYTVSCKVSDGRASDELSVTINVITKFL